ncbi:PaaI family thioesterase [Aquincola sp. S2]|uniref:Medium/long-chain acyl-CoA thioesterase YigI n=1 Tax=Pseudaquabacterium terrae TaxID=2732868 RepID=A0ABX2EJG1_9BURK|nr:PaaI family thioesterase [Aquabacterium terrae]NRF68707.1 PaaI family thioesterase [Aquabacterium terrae]
MSKPARIPFPVRIPFVEKLGLELHAFGDGQAELRCDLHEALLNSWEVAHGGVVMTMLDVAMAHAARSGHGGGPATGSGVATIEMKTSFMRPAEGALRAVGKLLHRTATMAFCEASLFDEHGALCAQATGTFKYLRGLPARGRVTSQTPTSDPLPKDTP